MLDVERPDGCFILSQYLDLRERDNFVMAEIGHRLTPIVPYQKPFTGNRAYIGIEANLRNPFGKFDDDMQSIKDRYTDQNVFFVDHDTGGNAIYTEGELSSRAYEGEYDTTTFLPDNSVDEVFLGNVFGDYHVAWHQNTDKLIRECARIIDQNGTIIVRETITPQNVQISDKALALQGLKQVARITTTNPSWDQIENIFAGTEFRIFNPNAYYLFIQGQY